MKKNNYQLFKEFFVSPKGSSQGTGDPKQVMFSLKILVEGMGTVPSEHDFVEVVLVLGFVFCMAKTMFTHDGKSTYKMDPKENRFCMGL